MSQAHISMYVNALGPMREGRMTTTESSRAADADQPSCCTSVLAAPITDEEVASLAQSFAALGDPTRLKLLSLLASAPGGEICACELIEPLGKSQPTISHHCKVLAETGLIHGDKRGRWVWYRVVPEQLDRLRAALRT